MAIKNAFFKFKAILCVIVALFIANAAFGESGKVVIYYFHGSFRCPTCHKLEQYSKEAIQENFKNQIAKGTLEFKTVNVEEKGNEHFVNDYKLYTKSLVISKIENSKEAEHKNLTKIWEYVRNKEKFFDYVTAEVKSYLEE